MIIGKDVVIERNQYLAGYKGSTIEVPRGPRRADAHFNGTVDELVRDFGITVHSPVYRALYNDVKMCSCGKPCAPTFRACNACKADLRDVKITQSENVFSAFLMGVKQTKSGLPYTISLRQHTDCLIFDDMLAMSPCHLNGIPAEYYIPDWRFLLLDPGRGLMLLRKLDTELWRVTETFLDTAGFKKRLFKGDPSKEDIKGKIIKSFNFPPSQSQLHIQWQVPPLFPFHHHMAEVGDHFHQGRAFPFAYVLAVLDYLAERDMKYDVRDDTPVGEIMEYFDQRGIVYNEYWARFSRNALRDSADCANWDHGEFQYLIDNGKAYRFTVSGNRIVKGHLAEDPAGKDIQPKSVQEADRLALQNYGRPYKDNRPSGTYVEKVLQPWIGPLGYQKWPPTDAEQQRDYEVVSYRTAAKCGDTCSIA